MKRKISILVLAVSAFFFVSCVSTPSSSSSLSLWNDNAPAKKALVEYVSAVTNKASADFIPVKDRIAVFDFDGTLFLETDPTYFDFLLFVHRVLDDPSYKATEEQLEAAHNFRDKGIAMGLSASRERMVSEAYAGLTIKEFEAYVRKFMKQEQPGFVNLKRGDAYYKPMVEVVNYLVANDFTVYVISGTDRITVRPLVVDGLGLPPKQVIGSDSTIVSSSQNGKDGLDHIFQKDEELLLGGKNLVKNLQMNKVSIIAREIGAQPVLAFGNSTTDASMINYSIYNNKYKALGFMLLCDDLEREYGNATKAEKALKESKKYGWIPVSMRDDWKTIYGDNVKKR